MMSQGKIKTLHPDGKNGSNISKDKYGQIKDYILRILSEKQTISYQQLNARAVADFKNSFDENVLWYVVTVKLDLEARRITARIPGTQSHVLRLKR